MFLKIIGIFAEFERENIIERTKLGFEKKVKEGYSLCTRNASYGYTREIGEKIQEIHESEAQVVQDIFDMYVHQGMSLTSIAKHLNIVGTPTKFNSTWSSIHIKRLLENCNYIGNVRHHTKDAELKQEYDGLHEAIILEELFDEAQELLAKNKKANKSKKPREENYFSKMLVCGKCGDKLVSHCTYKTLKSGAVSFYGSYRCSRHRVGACDTCEITHSKVEKAFQQYIDEIDTLEGADKINIQEQERQRQNQLEQITAYQEKLSKLDAKEREVLNRYVDNEIEFEDYTSMKNRIRNDKQFVQSELDKLHISVAEESTIKREDIISDFKENWQHLSMVEKRQFLVKFVKKIVVINEKEESQYFVTIKILDVVFHSN